MIETIARPLAETLVPRAGDPRLRAWIAARLRDASPVHLRGAASTAPAASATPDAGTTPDA